MSVQIKNKNSVVEEEKPEDPDDIEAALLAETAKKEAKRVFHIYETGVQQTFFMESRVGVFNFFVHHKNQELLVVQILHIQ